MFRCQKDNKLYIKLLPIDHGLSFPDCFEINKYFHYIFQTEF